MAGLRSDISDVLQAIDIFLFPSIYEGMPLSVVEAQASGLPCIISDAVTKMVNIGEDVIQLPLSKGADYWAEYLGNVKYELSRQERCERNTELITKAGYNIETEAENLMKIYKTCSIKYDIPLSQSHFANREMDVSRTFRNENRIYTFLNPVSYLIALENKSLFEQFDGILPMALYWFLP